MTRKSIDALAVLRRVSPSIPNEDFCDFDDALSAIAELIEADVRFNEAFHAWLVDRDSRIALNKLCYEADLRTAALARVTGSAQ